MQLRPIESNSVKVGKGNTHGHLVDKMYECPCGKGVVVYEIVDVTGFKDWKIHCECNDCRDKFIFLRGGIAEEKNM